MVTMPKHVGVKKLREQLALNCAFVGVTKASVYQMHITNTLNAIAI